MNTGRQLDETTELSVKVAELLKIQGDMIKQQAMVLEKIQNQRARTGNKDAELLRGLAAMIDNLTGVLEQILNKGDKPGGAARTE